MPNYPLRSPDAVWEPLAAVQPENFNRDDHINASLARFLLDHHEEAIEERFDEEALDELQEVAYDG